MIIPKNKVKNINKIIIFEFLSPEYLKIFIWLSLNKFTKNTCVEIRNINGNISKIRSKEFNVAR